MCGCVHLEIQQVLLRPHSSMSMYFIHQLVDQVLPFLAAFLIRSGMHAFICASDQPSDCRHSRGNLAPPILTSASPVDLGGDLVSEAGGFLLAEAQHLLQGSYILLKLLCEPALTA